MKLIPDVQEREQTKNLEGASHDIVAYIQWNRLEVLMASSFSQFVSQHVVCISYFQLMMLAKFTQTMYFNISICFIKNS